MTTAESQPSPNAGTPPPDVTIDAPPESAGTTLASAQAGDVRAHRVDASQSAIGRLVAQEVRSDQGAVGLVRAKRVVTSESAVGAIAADHVETGGGFTFLMLARKVSGDVTVLLDWRSAAAALGVLLVLGRLLRGRR
jgi:hypothetical protein